MLTCVKPSYKYVLMDGGSLLLSIVISQSTEQLSEHCRSSAKSSHLVASAGATYINLRPSILRPTASNPRDFTPPPLICHRPVTSYIVNALYSSKMVAATEDIWPNDAGFDTTYEEHEPVELTVKGSIPPYAAGVLCKCSRLQSKIFLDLT